MMKTYIVEAISDDALAYAEENLDVVRWDNPKIKDLSEVEAVLVRANKIDKPLLTQLPNSGLSLSMVLAQITSIFHMLKAKASS